MDRYRERADITDRAMFRQIRRGDNIQPNRITAHSARRIIRKRAANVGVKGFISGHSLRVGSAVSLMQAGANVVVFILRMATHAMKIKLNLYDERIFNYLYLLSLDY